MSREGAAEKLFRELDDRLYELREAQASHQVQARIGTELLQAALDAAYAEGLREAAKQIRYHNDDPGRFDETWDRFADAIERLAQRKGGRDE